MRVYLKYLKLPVYFVLFMLATILWVTPAHAAADVSKFDYNNSVYFRVDAGGAAVDSGQTQISSEGTNYLVNYDSKDALNPTADIGLGFNVNRYFRFDVVVGRLKVKWGGDSIEGNNPTGINAQDFSAEGVTTDYMLNVYLNLARAFGFSPRVGFYVGGGAGYAHNKLSNITTVLSVRAVGAAVASRNVVVAGADTTQFAWQVLTQMTYALTEHLQANVTYSHINAGNYTSSEDVSVITGQAIVNPIQTLPQLTLSANQFLVGLSFLI